MDPITGAMVLGAGANIAGGIMGGRAAKKAADKANEIQMAMYREMMDRLNAVGIPDIEAQKIVLQMPEFAGMADAVLLGKSALEDISTEDSLQQARKNALLQLQERSVEGLTAEDKLAAQKLRDAAIARQRSADQDITRSMSERGMLDSGATLAQRLLANQSAGQAEQRANLELAAQGQNNRMQALMQAAGLAGQMEQDQYGRSLNVANRQDAFEQANAAATMDTQRFNLGRQDMNAVNRANIANQQEIHNKSLQQQKFANEMLKTGALNQVSQGAGTGMANAAIQAGQGQAQMWSGIGAGIGQAANKYSDREFMKANPHLFAKA